MTTATCGVDSSNPAGVVIFDSRSLQIFSGLSLPQMITLRIAVAKLLDHVSICGSTQI